ncbi:MAG: YbaB/EbfC family nucleoid-associated protein [Ruminococcus sp.]
MKARLPQGYGGGGTSNLQHLAKQAQKMQADIETATAELEEKEYEAASGGGAVKVVATGKMEVKSIEISEDVVDPEDVEMLSDLVMAAVNEALRNASKDKEETMGKISGGLGSMNIPGLF